MIMEPVVAGSFYSSNARKLRQEIEDFLQAVELPEKYSNCLGIISPHAGYIYSGQCAAHGFKALQQKAFEIAIIVAPCHRFAGFEFSVGSFQGYRTPLGIADTAEDQIEILLQKEGFDFIPQAYRSENSLEVQIPFLQVIKPEVKILPVLIGNQGKKNSQQLAQTLAELIRKNRERYVLIASSDLSHYHAGGAAREMDLKLADLVQSGNAEEISRLIDERNIEACGFGAILTLLELARILDYKKIENLNYTHSGEISHDHSAVVGYLSTVVY
ncbi:MAG: AmmeMemoRadiSam system protein B [Candidatus Cloacimonetes bacterium]|nr:AmmeMemoRadiSam system protein B [Candidatus Cloacimonadota bacterium]